MKLWTMKLWTMALAGGVALVALPVLAQIDWRQPLTRGEVEARTRERLVKLDGNKDGVVARDEIAAFADSRRKARADRAFAALDSDRNGAISRAEFDVHHGGRRMRNHAAMRDTDGAMPPPPSPPAPPPAGATAPPPPPHLMGGHHGSDMAIMDGSGRIVIADAVKTALARFDAADTDKNGTLSDAERKSARGMRRGRHMPPVPPRPAS